MLTTPVLWGAKIRVSLAFAGCQPSQEVEVLDLRRNWTRDSPLPLWPLHRHAHIYVHTCTIQTYLLHGLFFRSLIIGWFCSYSLCLFIFLTYPQTNFILEQEDEEASTGSHLKLIVDAFLQQLPNCVNRDLIDKVCF